MDLYCSTHIYFFLLTLLFLNHQMTIIGLSKHLQPFKRQPHTTQRDL